MHALRLEETNMTVQDQLDLWGADRVTAAPVLVTVKDARTAARRQPQHGLRAHRRRRARGRPHRPQHARPARRDRRLCQQVARLHAEVLEPARAHGRAPGPPVAVTMTGERAHRSYHWAMDDGHVTRGAERRNGWSRPVSIPPDIDAGADKASGVVVPPQHVSWSGPKRTWDLDDRRQRAQLYEIVLTEGTDDDVRRFIDVDALLDLWDELYLSPHVRTAWADALRRLRGVELAC